MPFVDESFAGAFPYINLTLLGFLGPRKRLRYCESSPKKKNLEFTRLYDFECYEEKYVLTSKFLKTTRTNSFIWLCTDDL